MEFNCTFIPLSIEQLISCADKRLAAGDRFIQILAVNTEAGIDLVYSFMTKDGTVENYKICGVTKSDSVPSITDKFLAAFVFENEIHDLFGVNITGIAIDFGGKFYDLAQPEPMTIISPEQKAAREKAAKLAAAKAAKEAKAAQVQQETKAAQEASQSADVSQKDAALADTTEEAGE